MSDTASAVETLDDELPVSEDAPAIINLTTVYELVDAAEDRLAAQIDAINTKLDILLSQNNWLGQEMIPAVDGLHGKIDGIVNDVQSFLAMASKIRLPGMPKIAKGVTPDGG